MLNLSMVLESVAAIHGSCDNITINSGSVNAESWHSAGIGSGNYGTCNNITINNGSVNAKSEYGAGIGGGNHGSCNNITINSGSVNAEFYVWCRNW